VHPMVACPPRSMLCARAPSYPGCPPSRHRCSPRVSAHVLFRDWASPAWHYPSVRLTARPLLLLRACAAVAVAPSARDPLADPATGMWVGQPNALARGGGSGRGTRCAPHTPCSSTLAPRRAHTRPSMG